MASTFFDRIDHLIDEVGRGDLTGSVVVDQVYAHYQEVGADFHHPEGGQAYALRDTALGGSLSKNMEILAARAITEDGSDLVGAMRDVVEGWSEEYHVRAPREFNDLGESAHPTVTDDGAVVYDRPPRVGRLSEEELRQKDRLRSALGRGEIRHRAEERSRKFREP